jgi:DUF1009 family protein
MPRYGLIAGNGRFPILAFEAARELGFDVVAIGIKGRSVARNRKPRGEDVLDLSGPVEPAYRDL